MGWTNNSEQNMILQLIYFLDVGSTLIIMASKNENISVISKMLLLPLERKST